MLNRWIFLFCLPIIFLGAVPVEENSDKFTTGPVPAWVKSCDFDAKAPPAKDCNVNYQFILEDHQVNWEEKVQYVHRVIKVLSQSGAHDFTQLSFDFDPSYQKVVVHAIHILRDGEIINCLEKSQYKLLQRENSLERNLYQGTLSLVYFLSDIRKGDVVEFSYSLEGVHPFLASHCDNCVRLKYADLTDKIFKRLLIHPKNPLQVKSDNNAIAPKVVNLSSNLQEWTWEALSTPGMSTDKEIPSWHGLFDGQVQITQFKSWQEVVQKTLPLYQPPKDFEKNPSPEMVSLVKKWTEKAKDKHQQALLALRFVQDEIKYMGFEDGMGGFKPTDPRVVLERRFGDCKDKSVLLHSLLKLMQIHSTPALVNTAIGKKLSELLPGQFFNHVILRIEINNSHYWVDSTISFQGGSLQTNYCPEYYWGLVLSPDTKKLTMIPPSAVMKPTEIHTTITMTSPDTAELKIEGVWFGSRADELRTWLQQDGLKKVSEYGLEWAQKKYKVASISSPTSVVDDREKNVFSKTEFYKISTRSRLGKKLLKASSFILERDLDNGLNLERSSPYALVYPLWVKEHIHIENPFNTWPLDTEEASFENEAIKFTYEMKKEGHIADFHFELKHLQDHVPVNLIQDYLDIVQEVEPNPSLELVITAPNSKS